MNNFVPYDKLSKKDKREQDRAKRVKVNFNTGTRVINDAKHPSRAKQKDNIRKGDNDGT